VTDTVVPTAPATEPTTAPATEPTPRARPSWPGILAFALGLLTVAGLVTGIVLATADLYLAATYAAWAACGAGALAVVLGVAALVLRRARGLAVAGIVLGVVANPPLLTPALDAIGGLWA
jgi:uncharacterized membrane protein YcjF (UPF0283 family)